MHALEAERRVKQEDAARRSAEEARRAVEEATARQKAAEVQG